MHIRAVVESQEQGLTIISHFEMIKEILSQFQFLINLIKILSKYKS